MLTILAPAATILVGLLGLVGVIATIRQRANAEAADRFWKRLMWALDAAMSDDPRARHTGEHTLRILTTHRDCTDDDRRLIRNALEANLRHPLD